MKRLFIFATLALLSLSAAAQKIPSWEAGATPEQIESAKPWVYYYMMYGAISKEGFAADFEAMKSGGIGGAYLFSIRNSDRMPTASISSWVST